MPSFLTEIISPTNAKWRRVLYAFLVVGAIGATVIYFLGLRELWATKIVYYFWRSSIFGMFSDTYVPYACAVPYGDTSPLCKGNFGTEALDKTHAEIKYYAHIIYVPYILGFLINIRIALYCLSILERATGVDFLSRAIDKYLPGPRPNEHGDPKP